MPPETSTRSSTSPPSSYGVGHAVLAACGSEAVFEVMSYTYPLKLLSTRAFHNATAILYMVTYGGGLVSGDKVVLTVDIGVQTNLVLLTQGSTKVFKARLQNRLSANSSSEEGGTTIQTLKVNVAINGLLCLLPDPVTCFSGASYSQTQCFHVEGGGSAVILDWLTSGRMSRGEEWDFEKYRSTNEIWMGSKRVALDILLLEQGTVSQIKNGMHERSRLRDRLATYSCYATLFLLGPLCNPTISSLHSRYDSISMTQLAALPDFLWSLSPIEGGAVVRLASKETESVKHWLRDALLDLQTVIGKDCYQKAFL